MKIFFTIILFSLFTSTAKAQQLPSPDSTEKRTFVGIGLNTTAYEVRAKHKYRVMNGVVPFVNVHYGYRLSKRSTIQIGLGYGWNDLKGGGISRYISEDSVYNEEHGQNTRAVVVPITLKLTPFLPYRRLQLYANASIVPVLGQTEAWASESFNGSSTLLYDEKMYNVTMIATAGLTLNYRLSKRLDGYIDGILLYRNFQFDRPNPNFLDYASVGVGLNYRL